MIKPLIIKPLIKGFKKMHVNQIINKIIKKPKIKKSEQPAIH